MTNRLVSFLFFLLAAGLNLPAQNPYIRHYTTQDGLPSNTIYYVYQDSRKFIWFATDAGVSRYDGTTFANYRKKDGLAGNEVVYIKEDLFGRIWFFHLNGLLSFSFQNKIYNEVNAPFLKSIGGKEFYFDFMYDSDSTIYFYNRYCEIIVLDKRNAIKQLNIKDKLLAELPMRIGISPFLYLRRIIKTSTDGFLLWTGDGLFRQKSFSDRATLVNRFGPFKIFPAAEGSVFADLYSSKLYQFRETNLIDSITLPFYTEGYLKSVLIDQDNILWVADYFKGVYCLKKSVLLYRFDIKKPQSLLCDHEENVWIGSMSDGAYKISPNLLSHRHFSNSLFKAQGVFGLSPGCSGGVWLTSGNNVSLLKNNVFYNLKFDWENAFINFVLQMNNGSLLIGERGAAFYALTGFMLDDQRKLVRYRDSNRFMVGWKAIAVKRNGKQMSAFGGSGLYCSDLDAMFRGGKEMNMGYRIYSVFYNLDGELILNSQKMFYYRKNKLEPCKSLSRFDNKIITNHLVLGNETELFNMEGDSLYLYRKNIFYNLTDAFGVPIDLQVRNITYHEPSLYLSTSRNVYICDNPLDLIQKKSVRLRLLDVNFRNIHDILVNNDSLYVASDDGLTIIPENLTVKTTIQVPIPYIQSILVNDEEADPGNPGLSTRGNTKIAFSFGCVNYSSAPVLYAYRLAGLDTSWTTGNTGKVVYQRLPDGRYKFQLKVRKSTSEWSGIVEYPVHIKVSVWRHPLFFTFISILVLGQVTLLIVRRKNLQIKHRELDHRLITLELKALQSMMNPHFIFNVLGSIQNFLFQNKNDEAGLYLSQFARLIRQNMNALNEAMIGLDEEVDRLKNYLDLERLRMENKFDYRIDIEAHFEPEEMRIPSMIIQPFVENSIWHGISSLDGKGLIVITFSRLDENALKVVVTDNGIGIAKAQANQVKEEKHLKLGMEMTRKRLELLGRKYNVETCVEFSNAKENDANPGTKVFLVIPVTYTGA